LENGAPRDDQILEVIVNKNKTNATNIT